MDPDTPRQIIAAVEERRGEIVAFLQRLVQFDSVTGNETEIQGFIADHLNALGLRVDRFETDPDVLRQYPGFLEPEKPLAGRPNVVGVWEGRGAGRSLLLNGHVDTVPLEPLGEWARGPLSGSLADGKVWGRGASDMKGGVAAMTMAVAILKDMGRRLRGDVTLEYVVDEERTGLGTLTGQVCRVIDVEGKQVADFICFNLYDFADKLSPENTQSLNGTLCLTIGHHLYSTKATQLMAITADTCGVHDLIAGSCSEYTNAFRYGVRGTPNCRSNFERALKPYGIPITEIPYSFNIFMNVPVSAEGKTAIQEPKSKSGDYIDLRANIDLLIAISNCPQERNPCNGWNPTKLQVVVYEVEPIGKGALKQ